jgi:hypothetical protein
MESWRDSTSQQAQDDFDSLLNVCLPLAQDQLAKSRAFGPFHCTVTHDGQLALGMFAPEDSPGIDIVSGNREALRQQRGEIRSCAVAYDVRVADLKTDAIQIDLEHSDGATLTLVVPYSFAGLRRRLTLEPMRVSRGVPQIWVELAP